jgi:hypothetical protein
VSYSDGVEEQGDGHSSAGTQGFNRARGSPVFECGWTRLKVGEPKVRGTVHPHFFLGHHILVPPGRGASLAPKHTAAFPETVSALAQQTDKPSK